MNEIEKSERLKKGPVYLRNEFEGSVLRSIPGKKEYKVHHSTNMVTFAWLEWIEINKEEYKRF